MQPEVMHGSLSPRSHSRPGRHGSGAARRARRARRMRPARRAYRRAAGGRSTDHPRRARSEHRRQYPGPVPDPDAGLAAEPSRPVLPVLRGPQGKLYPPGLRRQPRRTLGNPCSRLTAPAGVELPDRAAAGARGEVPRTAAERCAQSGGQRRHPAHRLTRCTRAGRPARNRYVFPRARGTFVSAFARCRLAGRHQLHCLAGHRRQVVHARVSP